jgi:hypothetical protein
MMGEVKDIVHSAEAEENEDICCKPVKKIDREEQPVGGLGIILTKNWTYG